MGVPRRDRKARSVPLVFIEGRGGIKSRTGMPTKTKSKAKTRLARFELAETQMVQIWHSERVQQFSKLLVTSDYQTKPITVPETPIFRLQSPRQDPGILAQIIQRTNQLFLLRGCNSINLDEDFFQGFRKNYLESFNLARSGKQDFPTSRLHFFKFDSVIFQECLVFFIKLGIYLGLELVEFSLKGTVSFPNREIEIGPDNHRI